MTRWWPTFPALAPAAARARSTWWTGGRYPLPDYREMSLRLEGLREDGPPEWPGVSRVPEPPAAVLTTFSGRRRFARGLVCKRGGLESDAHRGARPIERCQ